MTELIAGAIVDGRYRIVREIARGGMSVVYCAVHELTGRTVAIKAIRDRHLDNERVKLRLLREARALELSRGPYVVDLLDAGLLPDGSPYLVMEMLEGRTLAGILAARRTLPFEDTVAVGIHICRALAHAHRGSVVHRDVKPSNVIVVHSAGGEFVAKLIDFGIAGIICSGQAPDSIAAQPRITQQGEFFGTPEYAAPEIMETVDCRSDIYSLGVTLFECLSGTVPHSGGFFQIVVKVLMASAPISVRELRPETPNELAALIARAMSTSMPERFATVAELEEALAGAIPQSPLRTAIPSPPSPPTIRAPFAPPAPVVQRRRYPRVPYTTPVRIAAACSTFINARSEDISEGGLLVLSDEPCPMDAPVDVRFMAPVSGRVVDARAVTRWVRDARGKAAVGLEFTSIEDSVREEIVGLVSRMGAGA